MVNDLPELPQREKKSKTPLIIGVVVALHVVLIGSAFVIQEINKRTRPLEEAVVSEPEHPTTPAVTEAPTFEAPEAVVAQAKPEPQPQPQARAEAPKAKAKPAAPKNKTVVKTYTVKKGDTWTTVSAKLKTPAKLLARDNKLDTKKFLRIGQKLNYKQTIKLASAKQEADAAPPVGLQASASAAGPQSAATMVVYQVKKGDTLGSIAAQHAMKIKELKAVNELKDDRIVPGQKLKVQQPGPKPATQSLLADVQPRHFSPTVHVVTAGETLSGLSKRYGIPQSVLMRANNIQDPAKIDAGSRIRIPDSEAKSAAGDLTSAHLLPMTGQTEIPEAEVTIEPESEQVAANF